MTADRQCPSCGGFCRKSGCERENFAQTDGLTPAEMRAGIALQLREIERLRVQVKQADARGDEAMRELRKAQDAIVAMAEDGWLYFGPEGMSEAQKLCNAAYESINGNVPGIVSA